MNLQGWELDDSPSGKHFKQEAPLFGSIFEHNGAINLLVSLKLDQISL
jgi:hypothetical protein